MAELEETLFGIVGAEEGEGAVMKWLNNLPTADRAAVLSAPLPVVGDIIGGAADFNAVKENPTPLNVSLAALGMLPFVPSGMRLLTKAEEASERVRPAVERALKEGANSPKSRDLLVEMGPRDFLKLAEEGRSQQKVRKLADNLAGKDLPLEETPMLWIDEAGDAVQVTGHEGRHRARVLQAMGEKKIPVRMRRKVMRGTETDMPKEIRSERELFGDID